jgi:hypothetical protein
LNSEKVNHKAAKDTKQDSKLQGEATLKETLPRVMVFTDQRGHVLDREV